MTPTRTPQQREDVVVAHVLRAQANKDPRLSAYLSALNLEGWSQSRLGTVLGVSHQAVGQRIAAARADTTTYDLSDLLVHPPTARPRPARDPLVTRSGLRVPDIAAIEAAAAVDVARELGQIGGVWERLVRAGEIVREGDNRRLYNERLKLAIALEFHEGASGIEAAGAWGKYDYHRTRKEYLGVDWATLKAMPDADRAQLLREKRIRRFRDAPDRYYSVACDIAARRARARAALPVRDDLIRLFKGAVPTVQVAKAAGVNASRVRQIVGATKPTPRTARAGA